MLMNNLKRKLIEVPGKSNNLKIIKNSINLMISSMLHMVIFILLNVTSTFSQIDPLLVQSYPGSPNTIYMKADSWLRQDIKNNAQEFLQKSFWPIVDAFAPFNVNITTDEEIYNSTPKRQRIMAYIISTDHIGGMAGLNNFGKSDNAKCDIFIDTSSSERWARIAATVPHEVGHLFELRHDGCSDELPDENCMGAYYIPNEGTWEPIMGKFEDGDIDNMKMQWYNGYKNSSHSSQGDIEMIGNLLGLSSDDIDTATLHIDGGVLTAELNNGIINSQSDKDIFRFSTTGGSVNLLIGPRNKISPLKVHSRILKTDGSEVLTGIEYGTPNLDSSYINGILPAGDYLLELDGIGKNINGDYKAFSAYNDYSSIGWFGISGSIENADETKPADLTIKIVSDSSIMACGNVMSVQVQISNAGLSKVTSHRIISLVDGAPYDTIQVNTAMASRTNYKRFIDIKCQGNHSVAFQVEILDQGVSDAFPSNNTTALVKYSLEPGVAAYAELQGFGTPASFSLNLRSSDGSLLLKESDLFQNGGNLKKSNSFCFCQEESNHLEINNAFNTSQGYSEESLWSAKQAYKTGDSVLAASDDGILYTYTAKWWTQNHPASSSDWTLGTECDKPGNVNDAFRLVEDQTGTILFELKAGSNPDSSYSQDINMEVAASKFLIKSDKYSAFSIKQQKDIIILNGPIEKVKQMCIIDSKGRTIRKLLGRAAVIDISDLSSGVYYLRLNEKRTKTYRFIKK